MKERISSPASFSEGPHLVRDVRRYIDTARTSLKNWHEEEKSQLSHADSNVVRLKDVKIRHRIKLLGDFEGKCRRLEDVLTRLDQNPTEGWKFLEDVKVR